MGEPTGVKSFISIGLEGTAATPVKGQVYLDAISENLLGKGEPIRSRALNQQPSATKAVQGQYRADGDINFEATPDKVTKILYAILTSLGSTGTVDPYTHVFKNAATLRPLTVQILRPTGQYFVYPGQYINRLTIRGVIDAIAEVTAGLAGRAKERIYDAEKSDVGIAYCTEDSFVFHQASTTLHGVASTDTNNWQIDIDTGLATPKGQGAGRAPNRAHSQERKVGFSFDVVFDTIEEHRRWMGAASSAYPINVADTLQTFAIQLLYTASANRILQIDLTKAYYRTSGMPVQGKGVVTQRCEGETLWDPTDTDIKITLKNGESNTVITTAGTDIP